MSNSVLRGRNTPASVSSSNFSFLFVNLSDLLALMITDYLLQNRKMQHIHNSNQIKKLIGFVISDSFATELVRLACADVRSIAVADYNVGML